MKTTLAKPDIDRKWYVVDASGQTLGRLAVKIANVLRGRHKPIYTPHIDAGDYVVVINADKVHLTGKKRSDKLYYWHTGYPGGIRSRTAANYLDGPKSDTVVRKAVERMLPKTKLGRSQLTKFRVFCGPEHTHAAQNPEVLDVASMNSKNKRSA